MRNHSRRSLIETFSLALKNFAARTADDLTTRKVQLRLKRNLNGFAIISENALVHSLPPLSLPPRTFRLWIRVIFYARNFSVEIEAIFSSTSLDPFEC